MLQYKSRVNKKGGAVLKKENKIISYVKGMDEMEAKKMLASILLEFDKIGYAGQPRELGEKKVLEEIGETVKNIYLDELYEK